MSFILHISTYKQGNFALLYERLNRETLIGSVVLGVALFQHERRRSRHSSLTLIHCSTNNRPKNSNWSTGSYSHTCTCAHTHTHTLTCPTFAFSQTNVSYTKASSGGNSLTSSTLIVTVTLLDSRGLSERSNKVLSMNQISENWKNVRHISYLKKEKIGQMKNSESLWRVILTPSNTLEDLMILKLLSCYNKSL